MYYGNVCDEPAVTPLPILHRRHEPVVGVSGTASETGDGGCPSSAAPIQNAHPAFSRAVLTLLLALHDA